MTENPEAAPLLMRFNLLFPASLESVVHSCLQEFEPPLPDYTVYEGEGHGAVFEGASLREQVRGCVARQLLVMLLPASHIPQVLSALGARIKDSRAQWWTESVVACGGLD